MDQTSICRIRSALSPCIFQLQSDPPKRGRGREGWEWQEGEGKEGTGPLDLFPRKNFLATPLVESELLTDLQTPTYRMVL